MGEWESFRLSDVCSKIGSGATPRGGSNVYLDKGSVALIRSQNVYNDGFHREGLVYLTEEHAAGLANVEVVEHDVLLNITGDSVARACQVDASILPARVNQHVAIIRPDETRLSSRFLRYFLVSYAMQAQMLSIAGAGATRNALTKSMIEAFDVVAPADVGEQRAIAHILGTLDDKIELNRRMNETLEALARAIFKSWFVDFDPVRAKAEGRDPVLPEHIADLFPDRFEDSDLGEIPTGWTVGNLGEVAENPRRTIKPAQMEESTTYIGLEHMPRQNISLADWDCSEGLESSKYEFERGEILFGKLRPYFHKVGVAPMDGICSTDIVVVAAKQPEWFGFVLEHMSSEDFVNYTTATSSGTKMPRTNWKDMLRFGVAIPPSSLAEAFNKQIQPFVEYIMANIHQARALAALRDALLPKVLSGDLRVNLRTEFPEVDGKRKRGAMR